MKKLINIIVIIIIAGNFNLVTAGSSFSGEKLKTACTDYLYKLWGNDVEISIVKKIQDQTFTEDAVTASCSGNKQNLRGNCVVAIEFINGKNKLIKRIEVPVRIKIFAPVPKALTSIKSGEIIEESQIVMEKSDITYLRENDLVDIQKVIGSKAKRNIAAGVVVTGGLLENNKIIRRGEIVRIIAQSGAVRISSTAKALQDAEVGQRIRIQREGTRNILEGYVAMDGSIFISSK